MALALLLAQGISAALLWRAQAERREAALVHTAAIRLFAATREQRLEGRHPPGAIEAARQLRVETAAASPLKPEDHRNSRAERELQEVLAGQGLTTKAVLVFRRGAQEYPMLSRRAARRAKVLGDRAPPSPREVMVAAVELAPQGWMLVRVPIPRPERGLLATLIAQTLLLYGLLFGAIALIVGQITKPLKALTRRLEQFAQTRDAQGQLEPQGPDDMHRLIVAHNAMEARLASLLDEKDVMLGAIGHDLKTPLAALRVRIEGVENPAERAKMAATIEDITRSLDDILSLARVGRPSDPLEVTDLSALVAGVAEEFEDMGEPVEFFGAQRTVLALRATWLRRAVRNLVVNALRYGQTARIVLTSENTHAVIRIDDDGPGIAADQIERMQEPFTRGEPSRNSITGGAGLGLTLARAIAEQHGGSLRLENRRDDAGDITGLTATIRLPL
ncbi:MAG: ATP-binding protein [Novosphingobium sp.]|uniref:sensor histidine kinase n=1 Tax=Novosphingobium sp. TaxID=1874826 RepID=UPI0032BDC6C0